MAICKNCGAEIAENAVFCSACGAKVEAQAEPVNDAQQNCQAEPEFTPVYDAPQSEEYTAEDINNNKVVALLSYIGILFLVPLLAAKESKYAQFHANQGLVLFIANLILGVAAAIPVLGWIVSAVGYIFTFVCMILGIVNAAQGKAKELPYIGKYRIIK